MGYPALKQFVPSKVCLDCDGCCRFQSADSPWRPKWNKKEFTDDHDYVTTIKGCGQELCRFFNPSDHICRTYHDRPFECELYPFLLSRSEEGIKVFVHLACPYVQDTQGGAQIASYIEYLKDFFRDPLTIGFLTRNEHLIHDYSSAMVELQYLFTIPHVNPPHPLLSHQKTFEDYVSRGARSLSCYHFSSIFAWKDFFEFTFEIIDDRLCVFAHQGKDSFLYLPPLGGDFGPSTIDKCFKRMEGSRIARIENISDNQLPALKAKGYNEFLKSHEYVYHRHDLVELAGHVYKPKRHDIHVFLREHPKADFRPYVPTDKPGCEALYKRWAQERRSHYHDAVYLAMLEENQGVHALLMTYASQLGLVGRVLVDQGEILGYTFGYALDERTFCVLLEVADLTKTGAAAHVFNQLCMDPELASLELINTMDDFGLPNVAATKKSYHPCQLIPVYSIKAK